MQFLGFASIAAVLVVAGVSAASTLRNGNTSETTSEGTVISEPKAAGPTKTAAKAATPKPAPVALQADEKPVVTAPVVPAASPTPPTSRPVSNAGYVLVEGRTQLADSIFAVRTGDSVVVNFDAFGFRTRRSAKLEQSLRLTLPLVFGKMAIASIDTVAIGGLVTSKDVIGELATSGMRVKLDNGAIARIRVLTRMVSDGPIAIGYLTTIER
jgi:hypothetical protein